MITVLVLLTIRDSSSFVRYEKQAASLMAAHGGSIDSAFQPGAGDTTANHRVDEIHVLKFPSRAAFESYRSDPKLAAMAELRAQAIAQTSIYVSEKEVNYS